MMSNRKDCQLYYNKIKNLRMLKLTDEIPIPIKFNQNRICFFHKKRSTTIKTNSQTLLEINLLSCVIFYDNLNFV